MNDPVSQVIDEELTGEIERLWLDERSRAAEILSAQKAQLDEIELRLAAQLELISSQLAADSVAVEGEHHADVERRRAEIEARRLQLEQEQEKTALEFQQWSDQLRQKQQELERRAEQLESSSRKVQQLERSLQSAREEHDAEIEQLARRKARYDEQQRRLDSELEALEAHRQETQQQRQRIAEQLKQQRARQLEELQRGRAELESGRDDQISRLRGECDRLAGQCAEHRAASEAQAAQNTTLLAELEKARQEIAHLQSELRAATELAHGVEEQLNSLRVAYADLQQQAARQAESTVDKTALDSLRCERDELARQLEQANGELEAVRSEAAAERQSAEAARTELAGQLETVQTQAAAAAQRASQLEARLVEAESNAVEAATKSTIADEQQVEDLQRRFELAVKDVRSLKRRNADLEDQLSALKTGRGDVRPSAAQGQDWESLKQRMLADLEAEAAPGPERKEERVSIENTIRITDEIVAQKDREIDELKQVLSHQSDNLGSVAVGAAAIDAIFDQDELIRQERERLQQAQTEWREKLRQAEVDISLERARIARERVELEEKLQAIEAERAQNQHAASGQPNEKGGKPSRGRWLERLGLKDNDK